MASLQNDAGSMRLAVALVDREAPPAGHLPLADGASGRFLCTAAVEHFDRRDREWWPFVRIPALYLGPAAVDALVEGARQVLQGSAPGFAWQPGLGVPIALQLGAADDGPGVVVEVGIDLGPWLAEMVAGPPGREACLFRFAATRADLVRFADALAAEARGVPAR
ncbi:MAG TPA: hypothetical protein VLD85_02365 [Anaeromyxobacteraceae bacterium]|nr:hypothetical protein [Anaeromyxobacteraceae bacterium]